MTATLEEVEPHVGLDRKEAEPDGELHNFLFR
jgi:hypothetical protein